MATWDAFDDFESLRRDIDRAFERAGPQLSPMMRSTFLPGRGARDYPLINLYEDQDTVYVEALAPGVDPKSLNVTVVGNMLTMSGEKPRAMGEVKPEAFHRDERAAGKFARNIELPVEIDDSKIKAEYKNGLVVISLPKSEKAKPRQISVQVA
ncbi:MAG TPA: Hsp20/alpha crystallin family protein [Candidatus Binatia bacterium]|nr:Hsp20/alpha crystallin family protein [Candidatus Binatia bacterium]